MFAKVITEDRMDSGLKVFSGRSHPELAEAICDNLGISLGKSHTVTFSNENMMVQIDENVRECDVFVVQTSVSPVHQQFGPTSSRGHLMLSWVYPFTP